MSPGTGKGSTHDVCLKALKERYGNIVLPPLGCSKAGDNSVWVSVNSPCNCSGKKYGCYFQTRITLYIPKGPIRVIVTHDQSMGAYKMNNIRTVERYNVDAETGQKISNIQETQGVTDTVAYI